MSSNDNDHHNQSHLQISDETLSKPSNEVLKRRSQLLNIMKPSLSLTSLPPQSPKEQSNETTTSTERPYNSLKVSIDTFFNTFSQTKRLLSALHPYVCHVYNSPATQFLIIILKKKNYSYWSVDPVDTI